MRLFNKNILLALALLAAAQGCDKEPVTPQDTGAPIMLSAAESGTKALLNNGTFNTTGNRLVIYDYVDNSTTPYFIDQIGPDVSGNSYGFTGVWPFVNGPHQWTPGTHKFFGWLAKDVKITTYNTPESFFGNGFSFNEEDKILTIPAKEMTLSTLQFDFLYSNIVSTEPQQEPVGLQFSHLFSAFRITALNRDDASVITITEIAISGLNNSKNAVINFSGSAPTVTYTESGTPSNFIFTYNATTGVLTSAAKNMSDTYLIWPQTPADFADATISIKYNYTKDGQTSANERSGIPLGSTLEWKGGVINSLNIEFDVDQITFYINSIEEWDYESEQDIEIGM